MLKPDTAPLPLEDGKASTTGVKHTVYRTVNEPDKKIAKANEQDNSSEPSLADTDPGVEKWAKADADLRRKLYGELPEQATILGVVQPKANLMHCKCGQIQTTWMPVPCGERNAEGILSAVFTRSRKPKPMNLLWARQTGQAFSPTTIRMTITTPRQTPTCPN